MARVTAVTANIQHVTLTADGATERGPTTPTGPAGKICGVPPEDSPNATPLTRVDNVLTAIQQPGP